MNNLQQHNDYNTVLTVSVKGSQQGSGFPKTGKLSMMNRPNPVFDPFNHYSNRVNHGCDPSAESVICRARWGRLIEGYINEEIGICLHVHTWLPSLNSEISNLALVFQKRTTDGVHVRESSTSRNPQFRGSPRGPRTNNMKSSVPVLSSPVVKDQQTSVVVPDHEFSRYFRSVVRLYSLDQQPALLREWRDLPSVALELATTVADRKFQSMVIDGNLSPRIQDGRRVDTAVQSGAELIQEFPQLESERSGEGQPVFCRDIDSACPIAIHAGLNGVGVFFKETIPRLGEGFAVSLCPFNAVPTVLEWVH